MKRIEAQISPTGQCANCRRWAPILAICYSHEPPQRFCDKCNKADIVAHMLAEENLFTCVNANAQDIRISMTRLYVYTTNSTKEDK